MLVLTVAALAAVAIGVGPDVDAIRRWIAGTGWVAPIVFALLYAGLTVALVPGSMLTLAAGPPLWRGTRIRADRGRRDGRRGRFRR